MVLRALGEAAMKTGTRVIEFGCRSLAVATGLDHTTVAAHLRALLSEADPLIDQLANDRGLRADLYTLRIPDALAVRASRRPWRGGRIQALRPVFYELGRPAALVYEALESSSDSLRSFDIAKTTGLSRTAVWDALNLLASHDLAHQTPQGWRNTSRSLTQLADQLGITETIRALVMRHRDERRRYRQALRIPEREHLTVLPGPELPPWRLPEPPPDDEQTAMELLERVLGAHLIQVA